MKYLSVVVAILFALSALFLSCKEQVEIHETSFSKHYSNGKDITVQREDHYSKMIGIITGNNYSESHSFNYKFVVSPGDYKWEGQARETPKRIIFCGSDIFLKIQGNKTVIDTVDLNATPVIIDTVYYLKNVDNRYFFHLFGDQYFTAVDNAIYLNKKHTCKEDVVPIN